MSSIVEFIRKIREARLGKDVRESIAKAIEQTYEDASKSGSSNMEVSEARGEFETLSKRLNNSDKLKADKDTVELEVENRKKEDNNLQSQINGLVSGSPLVANSVSDMTDINRVYVNTIDGHWYYYNGSTWIDGGVYQAIEIENNSISRKKINFLFSDEMQLFNKDSATPNKYVSSVDGNILTPSDEGMYWASDYIEIEPSTPYVTSDLRQQIAFYDNNKQFIKGINRGQTYEGNTPFISPANAKYFRTTVKNNIYDFVVNKGGIINSYTPFFKLLEDINYFDNRYIGYKNTENILNPKKVLKNYYDNDEGNVIPTIGSSNYCLTDFLPIAYKEYISSNFRIFQVGEYNSNFNFLNKKYLSDVEAYKYTPTNEDTKYIRIVFRITDDFNLYTTTLLKGNIDNVKILPNVIPNIIQKSIFKEMLNDDAVEYLINLSVSNSRILKNKKISFLGDSITYGYNGAKSNTRVDLPYPEIIKNNTGCISTNLGINGSTIGGTGEIIEGIRNGYEPMNIRISNVSSNADYLVIFGGTNDFFSSDAQVTLGTIKDEDNSTFYGGLKKMFEYYYNNFLNTKIGYILPLKRSMMNTKNKFGYELKDYINAIMEVCNMYSIPYLNLFDEGQCYPLNSIWKNRNLPDGLHPNQEFYYVLADKIQHFIEKL